MGLPSAVICCDTHHTRQDRLPGLSVDDDDLRALWVLWFRCINARDPRGSCGLLAMGKNGQKHSEPAMHIRSRLVSAELALEPSQLLVAADDPSTVHRPTI